ncbi:DUF1564 domain-containing protein [Leptospira sp. 201903070]|uniref:DUF1564 domain-containing protein n=1 Tax=Leptospira ainlahdjerensis TaxID=2810033 RepID=A0ABS2U6M5_9LEPT|nr:DUF1564 domain-containing protein [Leptospira ainlahdjerensis]MBM9576026.1 DUF1564 domain-containing protein [Leptospira ainlahdjerensis]
MGLLMLKGDHILRSRLQGNKTNVVTLLIPEKTLLRYPENERRILPKKIPILLKRYGKFLSSQRRLGRRTDTTLYQLSPGKNQLKKVNVRIGIESWVLLGVLAQAHGVSRCFLFNYLLHLEDAGVGDSIEKTMNQGAPTFHKNYRYILHLDLSGRRISRELECDPRDTFFVSDH